MTNTNIEKARAKIIKATQYAMDAHRILITEQGGDQGLHMAIESLLKSAAGLTLEQARAQVRAEDEKIGGTD